MRTSARGRAVEILIAWRKLNSPPLIPPHDAPIWQKLAPGDRALAFDLVHGVIRWRTTLQCVAQSLLDRPFDRLDGPVQTLLLLGLYQLLICDGIADYAAIDTTVEMARLYPSTTRAGGLVNAVLRATQRLLVEIEDRTALSADAFPLDFHRQVRLAKPVFPDPKADLPGHLALVTSHPLMLVRAMFTWMDSTAVVPVLIADNARPVIALRADESDYFPPVGLGLLAHKQKGYFLAIHGWSPALAREISIGFLSPQDPTAGKAAALLAQAISLSAKPATASSPRVLDLCAGMGTKTMQLARLLPRGKIVASDIDATKLEQLRNRGGQMEVLNVEIRKATELGTKPVFDAALVDVPCSNTGVLARRVQARWRWPALNVPDLRKSQIALVTQAAKLVITDGVLVYSTCSIDPAENNLLMDEFLASSIGQDWQKIEEFRALPTHTDIASQNCDGGYVCVLKRKM